jgi:chromosome segregation ATPase
MTSRAKNMTYDDVADICDLLRSVGQDPTQDRIKLILSSGSVTTISKHLNQWKSERAKRDWTLSPRLLRSIEAEVERKAHELNNEVSSAMGVLIAKHEKLKTEMAALSERYNVLVDSSATIEKTYKYDMEKMLKRYEADINAKEYEINRLNEKVENQNDLIERLRIEREKAIIKAATLEAVAKVLEIKGG